jgi:dsRNA-specific ribonuclease
MFLGVYCGMQLQHLQETIGYQFGDSAVLKLSLTHKSYGHEFFQNKPIAIRDNERLEFLGDSILDLIISDILLEAFPHADEGHLSKMRAALVNEKTLAQLAKAIGIQECVRLGKGEAQNKGHEKISILSSTLEALIAAVYLDGGYNAISTVVRHLFAPLFTPSFIKNLNHPKKNQNHPNNINNENREKNFILFCDHKTQLQEILQARWKITPTYHLMEANGPDHAKVFKIEVRMDKKILAVAKGTSKKEAEQNAAHAAILALC